MSGALAGAGSAAGAGQGRLLEATGLGKDFVLGGGKRVKRAVIDADIDVAAGERAAIIGESGSGKSTLVKLLLGLDWANSGRVWFGGRPVLGPGRRSRWLRRLTGIVFQDPYASLDPRWPVGRIIAEPLAALGLPGDHRRRVAEVLDQVGLHRNRAQEYPHQLSGGQRQRVALARGIVHRPRLLVGDEPLSALDVTIRAQILELLLELNRSEGLALTLVSHDLGLVQHFAERVWVMRDGRIEESGPTGQLLYHPAHPYTRALLAAVPRLRADTYH